MPTERGFVRLTPRVKRRLGWMILAGFAVVIGAELYVRYGIGLGDPPLMISDPEIEYLHKPSSEYVRLGNRMSFNRWSMRSDDMPIARSDPAELRLLFLGDSVIHGGANVDQADIASELIRARLPGIVHRPVVVGNASANSWGPANLLAYVRKYGLFEADLIIVVLSSHDWNDVPVFAPLGVHHPTRTPVLALEDWLRLNLRSYIPDAGPKQAPPEPAADDPDVVRSLAAVDELVRLARASGAQVAIALHLERRELRGSPLPGHAAIRRTAEEAGADIIELGPAFAGRRLSRTYGDYIHPTALGQRLIADRLMEWIVANADHAGVE